MQTDEGDQQSGNYENMQSEKAREGCTGDDGAAQQEHD
jgi:hypothetical protein